MTHQIPGPVAEDREFYDSELTLAEARLIAGREPMIGIVNADMFGAAAAPGEHVDWSAPDVDTAEGWQETLGMPVAEYAGQAPHMIVFELVLA